MDRADAIRNGKPSGPKKPFSILIVGVNWPLETFIERLVKGLMESGAMITVACEPKPGSSWLAHPQFKWIFAPTWNGSFLTRLCRTIRMIPRALIKGSDHVRILRAQINRSLGWSDQVSKYHELLPFAGVSSDVIYFPWNSAAISCLPLFDLGCPVVLSCRGAQVNIAPLNPHRASISDDLRRTFEKAAAVHCVSENILQEAEQYGLMRSKAKVIRPAVDPRLFEPASFSADDNEADVFQVTTTGSLIWRKGYEYALQAIRELRDTGIKVKFNILGDGPERQRVLYTINDLELNEDVELHGHHSPEKVRAILQRSDAFLLTSLSEGISNAVLEAMACGIPVVTTDCGGMREAVTDGVEGFVVPTRDISEIVHALGILRRDSELRSRMGEAGRRKIEESFSLSRQVEEFLVLCRSVAGGSGPLKNQ